ncbi:MAG: hypothetical protein WCH39_27090 [Schlesneria sp.]
MPLTPIQYSATTLRTTAGTSFTLSNFASPVTAGNTILVCVANYGVNLPAATDDLGNVYTPDIINYYGAYLTVLRAENVVAGTPTITISLRINSGSVIYFSACALECPPLKFAGILSANAGTGTTATAGSITTPSGSSLVIGVYSTDGAGSSSMSTSGFTRFGYVAGGSTEGLDAEYQVYSSSTTVNLTWTGISPWRCCALVYVAAPAATSSEVNFAMAG